MKSCEVSAELYYRSFLKHCFYDVEKLNINHLLNEYSSSILKSSSRRSLIERCDVIRSETRNLLKVLQIIVIHNTGSTPGVAVLVHDVSKDEVYCSLHLHDVSESDDRNSSVSTGLRDNRHFTIVLPECNIDLKMITFENLLFFCQSSSSSGFVLLMDISAVTNSSELLTPCPVLEDFSFLTCSAYYDDSHHSVLFSFLDTHKLFSLTIPVDFYRRREGISTIRVLYLSLPQGSLHFHVDRDLIIVCPSLKKETNWLSLFFMKEEPVCKYDMKARVCLYYSIVVGSHHYLVLLAMEDGSVQTFQFRSKTIVKGGLTKVFEGDILHKEAQEFVPMGGDKIALITKYQCALLSIVDTTLTGVVSVLSIYSSSEISNMTILKLQFPYELQGNFPFVLLVSTLGYAGVRIYSFQHMKTLCVNVDASPSGISSVISDDELELTTADLVNNKGGRVTGLFSHIKSIFQRGKTERRSGYFEPNIKNEDAILTLCQGFGELSIDKLSPPYQLIALDSRVRGFLVCVSTKNTNHCYLLRDYALHHALRQLWMVLGDG
ncbi:uncharacterized protein TM35_000252370 [Trypanosoma theileri]|uniref:Uncharacterized protein n=1 Tax=Trypanosoma theileri TaxID=67003 RepID=A0A1X0NQS0_9TRYP|nr:uncharacterized protein TM35_000252370 [Trypanosoma theileri]ORC86941.1 hypothetical protein TM35_000252370 [Trypanosoma theileri]